MTLFLVQLRQAMGGGSWPLLCKWSNIFYVDAASAVDAAGMGVDMWGLLKSAFGEYNYCYSVYASDLVEGTPNYAEIAIPAGDQRGTHNLDTNTQAYNPHVVYRVDLPVVSSRPSRKFLRPGFVKDEVGSGGLTITSARALEISDAFDQLFTEFGGILRDVDNEVITGFVPKGVTIRRLGKDAFSAVPSPPPLG